jgi:hypothetical protein
MAPTFAGGALRVTTPPSYDAQAVAPSSTRHLARELVLVEQIELTPRRPRGAASRAPAYHRAGTVRIELDLPPGQDAVVLLECDGVHSWLLPTDPATGTAVFEIDVRPGRPAGRTKPTPSEARTPGDVVHGVAQALVYRFPAPPPPEQPAS